MLVSPFSGMENQSKKFAVEIIQKTKTTESVWDIVNGLVAACTVLCSRSVANTILIAQLYWWTVFSQHPRLLCFSLCHPSEGTGDGQDVEMGHKADELVYQEDIPHHVTPQAAKRRGFRDIGHIFLQSTCERWWVVLQHLFCFNVFLSSSAPSLTEQFLAGSERFFANALPLLLPIPLWEGAKWENSCVVLNCLPGVIHVMAINVCRAEDSASFCATVQTDTSGLGEYI